MKRTDVYNGRNELNQTNLPNLTYTFSLHSQNLKEPKSMAYPQNKWYFMKFQKTANS